MTATILSFPTAFERDQIEFDRTDASPLTRAFDEAYHLWWELRAATDPAALAPRIQAFAKAVAHLATYRAEDLETLVNLGGGTKIALGLMPGVLMVGAGLNADPARRTA